MDTNTSKKDRGGSKAPDWLEQLDQEKKEKSTPAKKPSETVVKHTPEKKSKRTWKYSLKEGGQVYRINAPTTKDMINKVKDQLTHPRNWRRYARSPHGGDRNYTQLTCFPPFDTLRVAEVFFPDGTVWNSRKRKYIEPDAQ